jgi:RNase adapter protein RapZ
MNNKMPQVIIVTGFSGAGKSTVLRALEDDGYFCIDNLPSELLEAFFQLILSEGNERNFALGLDIRSSMIHEILTILKRVNNSTNYTIKIIFLTAHQNVLLKRFSETRRNHPLANGTSIDQAIEQEKKELVPLMEMADSVIQTDQLTAQQLRQVIRTSFTKKESSPKLIVNLLSFGFKYGTPRDCNFIYDVRSLPNPYFVPELHNFNGTQDAIQKYLFNQPAVQEYWQRLLDFFKFTIRQAAQEGRYFITIAVGCTGGRHRSVAFVHGLGKQKLDNVIFMIKHRDINQDSYREKEGL